MNKWNRSNIATQQGKTAVITGTGGIGYESALALAAAGASVIIAGRNAAKGETAVNNIRKSAPQADVNFEVLDLASLSSIRAFGKRMHDAGKPIDVLINNAAVMAIPTRRLTDDGFELQFGTNHLGHFLLTQQLLPLLRQAQSPVVTTVSSIAHRSGRIRLDDLQAEKRYHPWSAYQQSKLANLLFAFELQRRSQQHGWNLKSNAAHPGFARTDLLSNGPGDDSLIAQVSNVLLKPLISHSAAAGALPIVYAAVAPQAKPAGYYGPNGFYEMKGSVADAFVAQAARNQVVSQQLWSASEKLVGAKYPTADVPTSV
ncbi:MAG: SDR family oxidoreductase [Cyanobacteria bacterium SZAS LIN-3]|nr:SDR family oxidoreductase [Cyanobacteria bacterium SZAS LIN-3]MBS2005466.1 SDR family oxidoreductase [Cyanobacteria bacterium SZAS TMP-1]